MATIGTLRFNLHAVYNGKKIADMTDKEKQTLVEHWESKGTRCVIEGYNDKEE